MKTIGLIGGMSWESTVPYYRQINEAVKERLGGLHSAKIVLFSVDFHEIEQLQHAGDWDAAGAMLAEAARSLQAAGADFLVLCTNTMHKVASDIEAAVSIPLLHIADPTAIEIKRAGHATVGLLGTRFTMEQAFYRDRLSERHGLRVIVPCPQDIETVHRVIYDELCLGVVKPESRSEYRRVMKSLASQGARSIILGCTEISLLVNQEDSSVPLFDTTAIHARAAAEEALRSVMPNPPSAMQTRAVVLLDEAQCDELESFLVERIYEFNAEATGYCDGKLLGGSIKDEAGDVIAGFNGHTWGGCCEISHLWVSERHRGQGLGNILLRTAEAEAIRRGCLQVVLTTHSFQSPGFYERHGYVRKCAIEGRPTGHSNIVFSKLLADQSSA